MEVNTHAEPGGSAFKEFKLRVLAQQAQQQARLSAGGGGAGAPAEGGLSCWESDLEVNRVSACSAVVFHATTSAEAAGR